MTDIHRGVSAYFAGDYHVALDRLDAILPLLERASPRAYVNCFQALSYYALGEREAAQQALAAAWRIYPKSGRLMQLTGETIDFRHP